MQAEAAAEQWQAEEKVAAAEALRQAEARMTDLAELEIDELKAKNEELKANLVAQSIKSRRPVSHAVSGGAGQGRRN